jgi:hypothetical protein
VALVAEVVYDVGELPWHIVVADGTGVEGVPTTGVTTTVPLAQVVVLHVPVALT